MARKRDTAEQIIATLRAAAVAPDQGESVAKVARRLGIVSRPTPAGVRRGWGAPPGHAPAAAGGSRQLRQAEPGGAAAARPVLRRRPRADVGRAAPAPPDQRRRVHARVPPPRRRPVHGRDDDIRARG